MIAAVVAWRLFLLIDESLESSNSGGNNSGWTLNDIQLPTGFHIEEYAKTDGDVTLRLPRGMSVAQANGSTIVYS